uniref:Reverse transcriptase domain-containing protein n=1 Tax=Tanacetum cinerariifolium TaxID=118510 RepID=A0A6L2NHZ3_TANCI|nr:reverse transcriptase domain-containing protein [Tanacetum cinerariifolium]
MGRDTIQLENAVSTISQEYLMEFTFEYGILESLHPELSVPEDPIVEFPEGKFDMDLFSLIGAPNPAKVKTETHPWTPSTVEKSPLDFSNEDAPSLITESSGAEEQGQDELFQGAAPVGNPPHTRVALELDLEKETVDTGALVIERSSRKAIVTKDPDSKKSTSTSMLGSPGKLRHLPNDEFLNQYNTTLARKVAMGSQLRLRFEQVTKLLKKAVAQVARRDKRIKAREKQIRNVKALLEAEVDMKGVAKAKNVELAKELESLRVQFSDLQVRNNQLSQEVSTLQAQIIGEERIKAAFKEFKKYKDERVSSRCAEMDARLDVLSIDFDEELYPHMLTVIAGRRWVIGHGLRLAVMKCAESTELRQVFADVVSFGIAKGMSEGLKHGVEHGKAKVDLAAIEAYDPEADTKYVVALHALKDLEYPLVDQLEKLKDAPINLKILVYPEVHNPKDPWSCKDKILLEDAIVANVSRVEKKKKCRVVCHTHGVGSTHHARSDGVPVSVPIVAPQGLAPRIGSTHHARSDGVPVSVPIVAPQGLAILLSDAATQTEITDEASPRLIRSKSLPPLYDLDWPPGDFVYRSNEASHAIDKGKLGPKWEGPYEVTEALGDRAYMLRSMDEAVLSRTWNVANLKKCYL